MLWKTVQKFLIKLNTYKHRTTHRYLLKTNENIYLQKDLHLNVNSSFIHNSPKLETTQCLSADDWMNGLCGTHIPIDYYSPVKRYKLLIYTTTWVDFKNVTVHEKRQVQKVLYLYGSNYMNLQKTILIFLSSGERIE